MESNRKMVAPGSRDAPKFSSKKPHELRRFLRLMEDLWKEAGINDDNQKKKSVGKYADQDSEEEWAALDTFEDSYSWEQFKEELMENYPEAAAAERGTPARLRQLCAETHGIKLGDLPTLYAFRRAFLAEAKKLVKEPVVMANRELVELFIGCLSETMASAVLQFLGNNHKDKSKAAETKGKTAETVIGSSKDKEVATTSTASRRPEDRYDLDDVCKAAIHVSESSQGMFHLIGKSNTTNMEERAAFMFNQPVSETKALSQKVEELEGIQASERDKLVSMNKNMEYKLSEIEIMMKALLAPSSATKDDCKGDCKGSCTKTHETSSGSISKGGKSMDNERCFYCGKMGHFQADCDDLKSQIRSGNLKLNPEGRLRLKDGSFIPGFPNTTTLKERVERHYAKKPSQFYYGEYEEDDPPFTPKYTSQYLNVNEDEKRRARLEKELDIREKEEALELRKLKLEREEKRLGQSSSNSRAANLLDVLGLTDDELAALKAVRSGFQ
jgi:hypothetical protein